MSSARGTDKDWIANGPSLLYTLVGGYFAQGGPREQVALARVRARDTRGRVSIIF